MGDDLGSDDIEGAAVELIKGIPGSSALQQRIVLRTAPLP